MINKGVAAYCESQNNNLIITTAFGFFFSDVSSLIRTNQINLEKKVLFYQVMLKIFKACTFCCYSIFLLSSRMCYGNGNISLM